MYKVLSGGSGATVATDSVAWAISGVHTGVLATFRPAVGPVGFTNTVPPSLSGTLSIGQTLTVNPGTWTPTPGSYVYAWERATDAAGAGMESLGDSTHGTYVLGTADSGKYLRAFVDPEA